MKKFLAVLKSRNKEFYRDHGTMTWNFVFPILVIFGFAFAFSDSSQDVFKVAVVTSEVRSELPAGTSTSAEGSSEKKAFQPKNDFEKTRYIQFVETTDLEDSLSKLKRHQFDMVLQQTESKPQKYWINSTSPKGYLLEKVLLGTDRTSPPLFSKQIVEGREIRYVDWLISGLLAMNMMFSALFGIGYNIVRYRKNGVLKRLKATPLSAFEFLLAQVFSRLLLIVFVTVVVFLGSHCFIHFQMLGSYFNLFLVLLLGALCLISCGLVVAARITSEELAGGLLNLVSWPMMFLSGVWFSLEGAHPWIKKAALIFPLTHVIDASRAIMTEGASLAQVGMHLIVLLAITVFCLIVSSLTFKWT